MRRTLTRKLLKLSRWKASPVNRWRNSRLRNIGAYGSEFHSVWIKDLQLCIKYDYQSKPSLQALDYMTVLLHNTIKSVIINGLDLSRRLVSSQIHATLGTALVTCAVARILSTASLLVRTCLRDDGIMLADVYVYDSIIET
jgi:hypothetical protein